MMRYNYIRIDTKEVLSLNEPSQLHMTIVKEEPRRHRHSSGAGSERRSSSHESRERDRGDHAAPHSRRESTAEEQPGRANLRSDRRDKSEHGADHHHRRHYQDYGSVVLGTLAQPSAAQPPEPDPLSRQPDPEQEETHEPSRGQLQREFYDQYGPALNRRFNKSKNVRVLAVVAAALLAIAGIAFFVLRSFVVEEAPEAPVLETLAVENLNEGN